MTFKLITNGDSWTFGSEIIDPILLSKYPDKTHLTKFDLLEENDNYRIPKIWPTHLAAIMDADLVNLSYPSDDNGSILRRTMSYLTDNFIEKKISTEDIFVIIGWSSPERNSFWYDNGKHSLSLRIWPSLPTFSDNEFKKFWEYYVNNLWNPEEYIRRFIFDTVQFENFCVKHKINFLQFNSFYQTVGKNINQWVDLNIVDEIKKLKSENYLFHDSTSSKRNFATSNYMTLWNTVNPINFYNKDQLNNTFKGFIEANCKDPFNGTWHPSPDSHAAWATELHRYIKDNKLI